MATLTAIIGWIMANPQIIALGEKAVGDLIGWVTQAWNLHAQGVLTDDQLAAVWAAVGVNVNQADTAWVAALAAHKGAAK